ncbi:radical SAM protein [Clostridium thermobutyricum]|uniref:radical SAM protein n=1 Tax=Clostridium thermobutyricum TaxID=29372 RepID=UPI0029433BBB|nr:radical SAM protein [Clostridium thermobutyricum]
MSIDITNNCNLRCLNCFNRSGNDLIRNELSDEEFIIIDKEISENNLHTFCFCGGEHLLRYDLLLKMCDILSSHIYNINMVSNGYLMTKEKVLELKKHGMKHIQISIDGCSSKSHDYMRGVKVHMKKL